MATQKTIVIAGTPYLHGVGVNAGESLGNTSKLTMAASFDEIALSNYQGDGGDDDAFYRFKSCEMTLECRHVSLEMLKIALGATAVSVAAGPVADEEHTVVALNKLIALDNVQDMTQTLTVKNEAGDVTYNEGVHYIRKRAGIIPIATIAASDVILCSYTIHPHQVMQGLINSITEMGLLFDGINERSRSPWIGDWHRVAWKPAESVEFIGTEFATFTIKGKALAWDGITDPAKSKFYELKVGDL